jgi:hypothetical protein
MGDGPEPLCGTRAAIRAVAYIGTGQTSRLPSVRTQAPSRRHAVHCRRRDCEAHTVRAAFRHDQAETSDIWLVRVVLWQMASRNREPSLATHLAQDAQLVSHRSGMGGAVANDLPSPSLCSAGRLEWPAHPGGQSFPHTKEA